MNEKHWFDFRPAAEENQSELLNVFQKKTREESEKVGLKLSAARFVFETSSQTYKGFTVFRKAVTLHPLICGSTLGLTFSFYFRLLENNPSPLLELLCQKRLLSRLHPRLTNQSNQSASQERHLCKGANYRPVSIGMLYQ